jgi:hypothetical protein
VTPSGRAGATSAKRSASIPTQRSGQALRLLVLGNGEGAAAFRERAAEAGAELAQRFSVRVTHVITEDGIGDEDARVVRARTAGLPVLGLGEGARLLEDGAASDLSTSTDTEAEVDEGAVAAAAAGEAMAEDETDVDSDAAVEQEHATDSAAGAVGDSASTHRVQLVRPRSEFVPEPVEVAPVEVGPADVFTGSALEAVLLFPPLPVDAPADEDEETESQFQSESQSESELTVGSDLESDAAASALLEVAPAACGCGEGEARTDTGAEASTEVDGDVSVVELAGESTDAASPRPAGGTASSIAWALVPLVSLGLLTPVAMGYAAYRVRSRALWAATAGYSVAMAMAFGLSAAAPLRTGSHAAVGDALTICLAVSWLGGTAHSFLIRRRVFS